MNEEELFYKLFPEYVVNGKPLSPYFDLFESGYEQAEKHLEKENAELKRDKEDLIFIRNQNAKCMCEDKERLTNAKEIIKKLKALYFSPVVTKDDVKRQDEILEEAEQFLSEVEK